LTRFFAIPQQAILSPQNELEMLSKTAGKNRKNDAGFMRWRHVLRPVFRFARGTRQANPRRPWTPAAVGDKGAEKCYPVCANAKLPGKDAR
jgi:hypothetical protein